MFCTVGILMQKLKSDTLLKEWSHVIIDEVHERDIYTDLALTLIRDISAFRIKNEMDGLKIIIMSATLNSELFSK